MQAAAGPSGGSRNFTMNGLFLHKSRKSTKCRGASDAKMCPHLEREEVFASKKYETDTQSVTAALLEERFQFNQTG